jgi:hypothetical protein
MNFNRQDAYPEINWERVLRTVKKLEDFNANEEPELTLTEWSIVFGQITVRAAFRVAESGEEVNAYKVGGTK